MLSVKVQDAQLVINQNEIVDLRKPFKRIVFVPEGVDTIMRTPSETLDAPRKPLVYYVKITNTKAGALYNIERHGLQSHWIYNTNPSKSAVFKDKTLQTILHNLNSEQENFDLIRNYLSTVVNFLYKSYSFDAIYTSIPTLQSLTKEPVIVDTSRLTKLPQLTYETKRYRSVRALLNGHPQGLPARLFDWKIYKHINFKHTTIDRKKLKGYNNILVLTGTNIQYAGFLCREIKKLPGVKEVLPVSLFKI